METYKQNLGKVSITIDKNPWNQNKNYDRLVVVRPSGAYKTYISRKPVPAGTEITNEEYWKDFTALDESFVEDIYTKEEINEFLAQKADKNGNSQENFSANQIIAGSIKSPIDLNRHGVMVPDTLTDAEYMLTTSDGHTFACRIEYNSNRKLIALFNNENELISAIDATAFIKDGMIDSVYLADGYIVIIFNTDAGKDTIRIPLTDIFNPDDYYNKTYINQEFAKVEYLENKTNEVEENKESETKYPTSKGVYDIVEPLDEVTALALSNLNERVEDVLNDFVVNFTSDAGGSEIDKTYEEIDKAYNEGKQIKLKGYVGDAYIEVLLHKVTISNSKYYIATVTYEDDLQLTVIKIIENNSLIIRSYRFQSIDDRIDNIESNRTNKYPSEKAIVDELQFYSKKVYSVRITINPSNNSVTRITSTINNIVTAELDRNIIKASVTYGDYIYIVNLKTKSFPSDLYGRSYIGEWTHEGYHNVLLIYKNGSGNTVGTFTRTQYAKLWDTNQEVGAGSFAFVGIGSGVGLKFYGNDGNTYYARLLLDANLPSTGGIDFRLPVSGLDPSSDVTLALRSDLTNFITNSVNNLANYYLKSETYTKDEVGDLIGQIVHFHYEIAASTSAVTEPQSNVLYLIGPTGTGADKYEEYVYPNSTTGWVKIGDTTIDLSNYITTQILNNRLQSYLPLSGGSMTGSINLGFGVGNVLYASYDANDTSKNRELIKFDTLSYNGNNNFRGYTYGNKKANILIETDVAGLLLHKSTNPSNNTYTIYKIFDEGNTKTINGASLIGSGNLTLEDSSNKTNDIAGNSSNTTKYPSCKGVADYVDAQRFIITAGYNPEDVPTIDKTISEINTAWIAGKAVRLKFSYANSGIYFEEDVTKLQTVQNNTTTTTFVTHAVKSGVHYIVTIYEENNTTKFSFENREDRLFIAEYGVTTENEIYTAYDEGKIVIVVYNSIVYYLNDVSNGVTFSGVSNGSTINEITVSGSTWTLQTTSLEKTSDRISSITDDRRESKYPNERAVYDALFVKGVISQTQTWSGNADDGYTYAMSDIVRGDIAKTEIAKYTLLGATFNTTTGYFELNGITDLSLEEIRIAYHVTYEYNGQWTWTPSDLALRTTFPLVNGTKVIGGATNSNRNITNVLYYFNTHRIEVLALTHSNDYQLSLGGTSGYLFYVINTKLKEVIGALNVYNSSITSGSYFLRGCYRLETIRLVDLRSSWNAETLRRLSVASVAYAVEHAANGTTTITITLHKLVYLNCQADTTEYEYNGTTYTGIVALATAKNITIAQAS